MSRSVELFTPKNPEEVKIYTCGPTVYSELQLGNYRAYICQDILVKTLEYFGYTVNRVMNITDVGHLTSDEDEGEDKLEVGAKREGMTAWEVAKKYEASFLAGIKDFNIQIPKQLIRATDTISEQIKLIQDLEVKGYTYQISDGIYFDTSKLTDYGKLARLDIAGLQAGARVALQEEKKNITDFALWKFSVQPGQRDMEWESPWGTGFPGWHIECSAIALKQLGSELDIHAGGVDHIPVHHSNEIAQSETVTGKQLAKIWFHNEFLLIDGGKMGKSLGNAYVIADLKEKGINPLAFRLFVFSASYHSKLNFTWEAMHSAQTSLTRLHALAQSVVEGDNQGKARSDATNTYIERVEEGLTADLNISEVMAVLWEVLKSDLDSGQKYLFLQAVEPILSLDLLIPHSEEVLEIPQSIQELLDVRQLARAAKDWKRADEYRQKIETLGYQIIDTAGEAQLKLAPVVDK